MSNNVATKIHKQHLTWLFSALRMIASYYSTELGNHQRYIIIKQSQSSTGQKTPLTRSLPKLGLHHSQEYSSRRGSILYV